MKDCPIVDAVDEPETLHPLTRLRGIKAQARYVAQTLSAPCGQPSRRRDD